MRRFNRAGRGHWEPVQILGGPETRAIIQRPADVARPGQEYSAPSPTLRRARNGLIRSGQVILLPGGDRYLVADHSATKDWVTHQLWYCDRQLVWKRYAVTTAPVTELEIQGYLQEIGRPWVMYNRMRREVTDLVIRIDQQSHLLATGEDVHVNDVIDGLTVKRVTHVLGVNVVELQG